MRFRAIALVVSYLTLLFTFAFALPIAAAIALGEPLADTALTFAVPAAITFAVGWALRRYSRESEEELRDREAFASVGMTWILLSLLGSLPFLLRGTLTSPIDGFFESMSGLTTTGASVIPSLSSVPGSVLLWRAEMQWLGGMGIIVLSIVVLSRILGGGVSLMRAEVSTHQVTRLRPKLAQTAGLLWGVYLLFTAAEFLLLLGAGLTPLDALAHTFTTISTGGFSTRDASFADPGFYNVPAIDLIVFVFMIIGGINFNLHYEALFRRKWRKLVEDPEIRFFLGTIFLASLLISADLAVRGALDGASAVRQAFFSVTSVVTSTGYGNADFTTWPVSSQLILFTLMFVGGCSGSTAGGLKAVRILVVLQAARREVLRVVHPKAVVNVRIAGRALSEEMVNSVLTFFALYLLLFAAGALALAAMEIEPMTALSASASAIGNVGPGLGGAGDPQGNTGPLGNYAAYPDAAKLVLALLMWLGRLEIFAGLVVLFPLSYKK